MCILNIYSVDYRCTINGISKIKAVNLLQNDDGSKKVENFSLMCIKDG